MGHGTGIPRFGDPPWLRIARRRPDAVAPFDPPRLYSTARPQIPAGDRGARGLASKDTVGWGMGNARVGILKGAHGRVPNDAHG